MGRLAVLALMLLTLPLSRTLAGEGRGEGAVKLGAPRVLRVHPAGDRLWLATTTGLWQLDRGGRVQRVWDERDGLPSAVIADVAPAADGQLWVATIAGTARLEGEQFVTVNDGLPSTDVTVLLATGNGALYAGTGRGVARLEADRWQPWLEVHQFGRDRVLAAVESATGSLWFAKTSSLAILAPDGSTQVMWRDPLNPAAVIALPSTAIHALAVDRSGRLWLAGDSGLSVLAGFELEQHWRWRRGVWGEGGLPGERVWSIFHERSGATWLTFGDGHDRGLVARRLPAADAWERIDVGTAPLPACYSLAQDVDGMIWLGTSDGLFRFEHDRFTPWPMTD